ncbi:MAG: protein-L-isoaspartate(D-aspartate) O-methyltransferase [Dehalococcoidia bacterium]
MDFATARSSLIAQMRREIKDERVLQAMEEVPRELFVPTESRDLAYEDRPLPIGMGQTISQPFIVALMTMALELRGGERVLEVGTGSGYQAAILAHLAGQVVTVERQEKLAETARDILARLGYTNVEVHVAEKTLGWRAAAPYDAILVSAGAPEVPPELLGQLAVGGRLVIPVGSRYEQELIKVTRWQNREVMERLGACRFVPLVGEGAWQTEGSQP